MQPALPEPRIRRAPRELLPPRLSYGEADRLRYLRWSVDAGHGSYTEWDGEPDRRIPSSERGR